MSSPNLFGSNRTKAQSVAEISGYNGGVIITGTAKITGAFSKIEALTATVIALIESEGNGALQGTKTAVSLAAGAKITGNIQSVTLTSGSVVAYF